MKNKITLKLIMTLLVFLALGFSDRALAQKNKQAAPLSKRMQLQSGSGLTKQEANQLATVLRMVQNAQYQQAVPYLYTCLLYTSPSPRD